MELCSYCWGCRVAERVAVCCRFRSIRLPRTVAGGEESRSPDCSEAVVRFDTWLWLDHLISCPSFDLLLCVQCKSLPFDL